jgi:transposase
MGITTVMAATAMRGDTPNDMGEQPHQPSRQNEARGGEYQGAAKRATTQPPAPSHPIARGRAGAKLLAHVLFSKYSLHLPLNRQSATYAREGIDLDVSTLADWVGVAAATLTPLVTAILMHVFAGERIHAGDTTVPVLAKSKTRTGRLWTYVRDDRPFAGPDPSGQCSSTRAIVAASIPSNIWPTMPD